MGGQTVVTAMAIYSNGSTKDVTETATWSSSNIAVANFDDDPCGRRVARGLASGSATVDAEYGELFTSAALEVAPLTLDSLEISLEEDTLARGTTGSIVAVGRFSDSSQRDLTDDVEWSSSDPDVVEVIAPDCGKRRARATVSSGSTLSADPGGVVAPRAVTLTPATLTARVGAVVAQRTVNVSDAVLSTLEITPSAPHIGPGTTVGLKAIGTFDDGSTQDLTEDVTWRTANPLVADVGSAPDAAGVVDGRWAGTTEISARFQGKTALADVTVGEGELVELQLTPLSPTLVVGTTVQLVATGKYSDGTTQDLTNDVAWSSSSGLVASVTNSKGKHGHVTAWTAGSTTVSAMLGAVQAQTAVDVSAATLTSIQVTPTAPVRAIGSSFPLTATGLFSDGSTQDLTTAASWTSTAPTLVQVDNAPGKNGIVTALAAGPSDVSATFDGITGSTVVTVSAAVLVSIDVTPSLPSIASGTTLQLTATGVYDDATTQDLTDSVTWSSAAPGIATVSNATGTRGLVSALAVGSSLVSATGPGGVTGSTTLGVSDAVLESLAITPSSPSLAAGLLLPLTATGTYSNGSTQDLTDSVTWTTTDATVATVSNAVGSKGTLNAILAGQATIEASSGAITDAIVVNVTSAVLQSIDLSPLTPSMAIGLTVPISATGNYSDGSTQNLTDTATWTSDTIGVATVSNAPGSEGIVTSVAIGTAQITATLGAVQASTVVSITSAVLTSIEVTPTSPTVAAGTLQQLTATGLYDNATTQDLTDSVTWSSAATGVATVSNAAGTRGLATAVAVGSSLITATGPGAIMGSTTLGVSSAVLESLAITPSAPSLAAGLMTPLTATGTYSDASNQDLTDAVTWTTSNASVATVSNAGGSEGTLSALSIGSATIGASSGAINDEITADVTAAVLESIDLSPLTPSVALGLTVPMTATGNYSDGSTQDLTDTVAWTSDMTGIATVSNAPGLEGLVTSVAVGTAQITATPGAVQSSTNVSITSAVLTTIDVTPATPSIALGLTVALQATGTYSDASMVDLTDSVTWTTSNSGIATVSNAPGTEGLVASVALGGADITATLGAVMGTGAVTITAAELVSIQVTPTSPTAVIGLFQQLTATGTFTDASMMDITDSVTWSTQNALIAIVSNLLGTEGLVTAVALGTVNITATLGAVSDMVSFQVTLL